MTIQEALDRIDIMRPNMIRKEIKIAALSELDGLVYREIIQNHEEAHGHRPMTPTEQILFLKPEERTFDGTRPPWEEADEAEEEDTETEEMEEDTGDGKHHHGRHGHHGHRGHGHHGPEECVPAYTMETDPGTELLVRFPHDELYVWWLASKIDWQNQEIDKYNNDRALFNNAYNTFSDWYTRTHMPKQRTREFRI